MTTTIKTVTGIAAVAAIGTGVLFTTTDNPDNVVNDAPVEAIVEFVDDIKSIEVPIFSVNLPNIDVIKVELFDVEIPNVENLSPETIQIATTIIESIGVKNLSPEQIKVVVQIVEAVQAEGYSVETIKIAVNVVSTIGVENFSPVQIKIIVNTINNLDGDIAKIQALQKMLVSIIKDQRTLEYDSTLNIYNKALIEWLEIYNKPLPEPIAYIALPKNIRMIAELRSITYAKENLAFYKQQGYNACLITINGTENVNNIFNLINCVRECDLQPWVAWSGPERLEWSIYQSPKKILGLLKAIVPRCVGYIPAWRRTSAHLVAQDAQYIEYLTTEIRKANPTILVVGESYYGQTWENLPHINQRGWEARDNVVKNQSGILIAGISTQGYAVETMLSNIFGKWKNVDKLAMILGEKPYYASTYNTNKSFLQNLQIKQQLEKRFLRAGCTGTVTIHGDGSDRGSTVQTVDDLGKYELQTPVGF